MKNLMLLVAAILSVALSCPSSLAQAETQWAVSGTLYMADGSPATSDDNRTAAVFVLTDDQMKQFNKCLEDGIDRLHCADRNQTASVPTEHDGSFLFHLKDNTYHLLGVVNVVDTFSQYFGMETIQVHGADVHRNIGLNQ